MTLTSRSIFLALVSASALAVPLGLAAPANAQTKLKLVLNWKYQGPQGMFFLADDRGYFKAEGLDVTLDQGSGSGAAVAGIRAARPSPSTLIMDVFCSTMDTMTCGSIARFLRAVTMASCTSTWVRPRARMEPA